ncbi:dUTP diphosphatase [bacterium NHP-B]|nr:dUTP diphosphatase [Candidatus Hepatobacter penaei]TGW15488.1 dUTP diphosphatase [bacterium NHP-B]
MRVPIQRVGEGLNLPLPAYATPGSVGMDLYAALSVQQDISPRTWRLIPAGITLALPPGYEGQVRSRSGLALKHGLQVLNAPGTIDQDYRGEVKVIVMNHSDVSFCVEPAMRIAQLVIAPVVQATLSEAMPLSGDTQRGQGGFGSTGQ